MNILYQEIREQPLAVEHCLALNTAHATGIVARMQARNVRTLMLLARGTSRNAALYAHYLWGWQRRLPVQLIQPSLTTFLDALPLLPDTAVIAVSQSGSSPDLGQVMRTARQQGAYGLAVTNAPHSPLATEADDVLPIAAGPEKAVAATKSYTNQLVALALLSQAWNPDLPTARSLAALMDAVEAMFALEDRIRDVAQELWDCPAMLVIGRGFHHATACEMALKLQEIAYIHAMPFTSADFLHGPIALLEENAVAICLDAGAQANPHFQEIEARAAQAGARLVALTHEPQRWRQATHVLPLPAAVHVADCHTPIPLIVAGQLLALHIGLAKGLDVVAPRFLTKETLTA